MCRPLCSHASVGKCNALLCRLAVKSVAQCRLARIGCVSPGEIWTPLRGKSHATVLGVASSAHPSLASCDIFFSPCLLTEDSRAPPRPPQRTARRPWSCQRQAEMCLMWSSAPVPAGRHQSLIDSKSQSHLTVHFRRPLRSPAPFLSTTSSTTSTSTRLIFSED